MNDKEGDPLNKKPIPKLSLLKETLILYFWHTTVGLKIIEICT